MFAVINLHDQPGLAALLQDDETIEDLMKLSPEQILLRWVNYQLRQSGCERQITNLTSDIKDSVVYIHLINQIAPPDVGIKVNTNALHVSTRKDVDLMPSAGMICGRPSSCRAYIFVY